MIIKWEFYGQINETLKSVMDPARDEELTDPCHGFSVRKEALLGSISFSWVEISNPVQTPEEDNGGNLEM